MSQPQFSPPPCGGGGAQSRRGEVLALRLGLREVDGLKEGDVLSLFRHSVQARASARDTEPSFGGKEAGFQITRHAALSRVSGMADMVKLGIPVSALEKLAAADCFRSLGLDRRQALWEVKALAKAKPLPLFAFADARDAGVEVQVALPQMPLSEHVVNDYQTIRLSLKAHPMSFLRTRCNAERVIDNQKLKSTRNGAYVSIAGVVLVRQRPGSAKGVVFLTLEDEFGVANAVVWPQVLETHRAIVMGARLMLIRGRVQRTGDIIHVVANRIEDRTGWLALLTEDGALMKNTVARADEVKKPGPELPQHSATRHPRNVRVMPKSRDFH